MSSCENPNGKSIIHPIFTVPNILNKIAFPEDLNETSSKDELKEMEEGFHEAMKSIEMIKVLRQLQTSLEDNILELLEGTEDFEDIEQEGAAGGHSDTLSKLEMEKLRTSKAEASQRYKDFKKTAAEGAKKSFKCKEIEEQLARMIQDMQEFDTTLNLITNEETIPKKND